MARLWEYDNDGEPWLENMPLLIVNPKRSKRSKKGKKMAVRRKKRSNRRTSRVHRVGRKRTNPRRHRRARRRNPWTMPGVVAAANPRRRRRGRRNSPRRHRRSRRNPGFLSGLVALPPLKAVGFAGIGFVGTPWLEGFLNGIFPVSFSSTTFGKYVTRIAAALGVGYITKLVAGGEAGKMAGIGGGAYVLLSAGREFFPTVIPAMPGLSAYATPTRNPLAAYTRPTSRTFNSLGAANYGGVLSTQTAPSGGMNLVAQRYRRFN